MLIVGAVIGWMLAQLGFPQTRWISEWLCYGVAAMGTVMLHHGRRRRHLIAKSAGSDAQV
ncbi:hypothetical protein [Caulobacter sp. FWC2]|uniref:hypothetical protein n=1 Tax=Caulobacter sp. FWC2 TaxID=69664 RepID=UPI00117804E0|nr:hypothetical protein [Caulobacter sp. FWC2]